MYIITITCGSQFLALNNEKYASSACRGIRGFNFIVLGVSAAAPLFYLSVVNGDHPYMSKFTLAPWIIGGFCYATTCGIYVWQFPERYYKKTFDLIGQSHQIFHIGVLLGAAIHFNASLNLFYARQQFVCPVEMPKNV